MDVGVQVVLGNEFTGYVGELDPDVFCVFRAVKRGTKVEVLDVDACKLVSCLGGDIVDEELDNLEGSGLCACIPWVADLVAANCYLCVVKSPPVVVGLYRPLLYR